MKDLLRAILPKQAWKMLQNEKKRKKFSIIKKIDALGLNFVPKDDVYSPLPVWENLLKSEKRWNKPSLMKGVEYDIEKMKSFLAHLITTHYSKLKDFKDLSLLDEYGVGYQQIDAIALYCIMAENKPGKFYEVGGGVTTFIADFARKKYLQAQKTKIVAVEPFPSPKLYELEDITLIKDEGQNIPVDFFDELEENDVLFIDTTHVVKVDGEVNYFILEILPRLKKGVLIHFHDIPFPYNTPHPADYWITSRKVEALDQLRYPMYWTEPMMLQAFLAYNDSFKIEMSLPLLRHHDEAFLKKTIPGYKTIQEDPNTFSSLWIRKVK